MAAGLTVKMKTIIDYVYCKKRPNNRFNPRPNHSKFLQYSTKMDSILISAGPIFTVYKVDSLPSAPARTPVEQQHLSSSKDSEQKKIIERHTHSHQSPHANSYFIGTAVINTHTHTQMADSSTGTSGTARTKNI